MDLSGRLRGLCSDLNGPGSGLILPRSQEAHESQCAVAGADQFIQTGFRHAQVLQEHGALVIVELGNLRLDTRADHKHLTSCLCRIFANLLHTWIICAVIGMIIFRYVCGIDHRLIGQKIVGLHPLLFVFRQVLKQRGRLAALKMLLEALEESHLLSGFLVHLGCSSHFRNTALQNFQICKDQFQIDCLDVAHRIHTAIYVNHIAVLEAAHYMNDRVYFTNISEELVSKAFTFRSTLDQTGDVNELNDSRCDLLGMIHFPQKANSLIRDRYNADVGVDRTERIVCRFCSCLCQRIKKCALSHIRKTYDA